MAKSKQVSKRRWELLQGDCEKIWPKKKVDLIVTDPPYGINYKHAPVGDWKRKNMAKNKWTLPKTIANDDVILSKWAELAYQSLKDGGALYMFTRWDVEPDWRTVLVEAGFNLKQRLIWSKHTAAPGDLEGSYMHTYEDILFAVKKRHILNHRPPSAILDFTQPIIQRVDRHHPHEKPVPLLKYLIEASSKPGDLVLDPFAGSGSTGVAAVRSNRRFLGIELDPRHAKTARARLTATKATVPKKVDGGEGLL